MSFHIPRVPCTHRMAQVACHGTWQPHCRTSRPNASWPCSRRVSACSKGISQRGGIQSAQGVIKEMLQTALSDFSGSWGCSAPPRMLLPLLVPCVLHKYLCSLCVTVGCGSLDIPPGELPVPFSCSGRRRNTHFLSWRQTVSLPGAFTTLPS